MIFNANLLFRLTANDLATSWLSNNLQASYGYSVLVMPENEVQPAFNEELSQDDGYFSATDFQRMHVKAKEPDIHSAHAGNKVLSAECKRWNKCNILNN